MQAPDYTRLRRFWRRHRGAQALLLCNGPSLRQVDFARVNRARFKVFGLNKIYLGFDMLGWQPDYLVAVNEKVLRQSLAVYSTLRMPKFVSNRLPLDELPDDPLTFPMRTTGLPPGLPRFSTDIVRGVREGWTVTHAALQVIYYMGFRQVFIVGMDHRFTQHVPGQENAESIITGDDVDHFHPQYFGGQKWDFPDLHNSEISYQAARQAFEADGRRIVDCTPGGACPVFERGAVEAVYG
jgi:hypothetical protein